MLFGSCELKYFNRIILCANFKLADTFILVAFVLDIWRSIRPSWLLDNFLLVKEFLLQTQGI